MDLCRIKRDPHSTPAPGPYGVPRRLIADEVLIGRESDSIGGVQGRRPRGSERAGLNEIAARPCYWDDDPDAPARLKFDPVWRRCRNRSRQNRPKMCATGNDRGRRENACKAGPRGTPKPVELASCFHARRVPPCRFSTSHRPENLNPAPALPRARPRVRAAGFAPPPKRVHAEVCLAPPGFG
jgi:hypothetical protein